MPCKTTTGDFLVDEKAHTVTLTDDGVSTVERLLSLDNLYDMGNMDVLHGINQGLRAHNLFKRGIVLSMRSTRSWSMKPGLH